MGKLWSELQTNIIEISISNLVNRPMLFIALGCIKRSNEPKCDLIIVINELSSHLKSFDFVVVGGGGVYFKTNYGNCIFTRLKS